MIVYSRALAPMYLDARALPWMPFTGILGDSVPSEWHDAFVRLIKERPKLAPKILREVMGVDLPPDLPARLAPEVFNDRPSVDLITDKMILVGPEGSPTRAVIVEVQADEKKSKRRQIPRYAMTAWLWYECPVDVLVLCPDEKTAAYYAEPLPTVLEDCLYRPKPLLPSRVPHIHDPATVTADPAMGMLSVVYHGQDPAVAEAFVEGIAALGPEQGGAYYEYANALSPQPVRDILEVIVSTAQTPRYSAFAKRHFAEGKAEGEVQGEVIGERHTIRMVLKARGLTLTEEQSRHIDACDDLATLKEWSEAALTAKGTGDIFR